MKLLERLLQGGPCSYPKRFSRRGGSRAGLSAGAEAWRRKHHEVCDDCRLRERREQQYLERLRGAAVPVASDDLTARLLARTEELAGAAPPAAGLADAAPPASPSGTLPAGEQHWAPRRGSVRQRTRLAAITAGGAAAAVALMTGSAYLMGASAAPLATGETSPAFQQKDLGLSAAAATADAGTAPGWSVPGEPDIAPAGALTAGQLTALRARGWTCPELHELGYHLVWARAGTVAGADIVELRLTDGRHFATVLEQHGGQPPQPGRAGLQQPAVAPPLNVLTGHSAGADGFTAAGTAGAGLSAGTPPGTFSAAGGGRLWINAAPPFRAIFQASGSTFTYVSDQPADEAGQGLAALMRTSALQRPDRQPAGPAAPDGAAPDDAAVGAATPAGITSRIERGFGRILELLAP